MPPPLAMRFWLSQRKSGSGKNDSTLAPRGRSPGHAMSMESLEHIEHMVKGRVKTFLRHTLLVTILGTLVLGGAIWLTVYMTTKATVLKIAAGPANGIDVQFVQALGRRFAQDHDKMRLQLVTTDGPAQSAEAIAKRQADFAIVRSDIGTSADWPVIAILRQNTMALIVPASGARAAKKGKRKAEKIEKVGELAGKRVGIVTGNEASLGLLKVVLNHYGIPDDKIVMKKDEPPADTAAAAAEKPAAANAAADKAAAAAAKEAAAKAAAERAAAAKALAQSVQVSMIDPKDLAKAIQDDQVDVIFVAGPATGHAISDAVAAASHGDDAPTFVEIDQGDGIAHRARAFDAVTIDAGTFGGNPPTPDDDLKSLSFPEYLVARKTSNSDKIAAFSKLLYEARQSLAAELPGEIKIEAPSTDKDADVLVHPGAKAYIDDGQQSFFDRYGDDIFYGMLIFPVFGSMIAGAASYFRSNTRTRRLRLLQALLDLTKKAHQAKSIEAVDQLQIDTDKLVVATIHQTEREEFDESARMSFSLAIEQARFAIAARRTVLLEGGGSAPVSAPASAAATAAANEAEAA
jgi:TRAP-type uncharacterized transport system substrate-binding protein